MENGAYTGYKNIQMSEMEMAEFYGDLGINRYGCLVNEYLMISNVDGKIVDNYRWSGKRYERVTNKTISSSFIGKIESRNPQQMLAIDMLYNDDVTVKVLSGVFGSGKDLLMASVSFDLLRKNKVSRIVWVRNNVQVRNTKDIGALPGGVYDKLLPFAMPLADHVGGVHGLEMLINQNQVEVIHLGFIRGRDIRNSIIICSEAENITREHLQLLISRVGEGSSLWINGDLKQTDSKLFDANNALLASVKSLKGNSLFGYVHLPKTERSPTAELAALLD